MILKIKKAHSQRVVGFNNSGLPLGQRKDLLDLAIIAREANDALLLSFFEGDVPSLEKLKQEKAKSVLPPVPSPASTNNEEPNTGQLMTISEKSLSDDWSNDSKLFAKENKIPPTKKDSSIRGNVPKMENPPPPPKKKEDDQ